MIRTIHIEINAANPQMPLMPLEPYEGSAVSLVILNVPRPLGKRSIDGIKVTITNASGIVSAFNATRNGSAWSVTIPATAVGAAGSVTSGIVISASGTNEGGAAVACWVLGVGDLVVLSSDGTPVPDVPKRVCHWHSTEPATPYAGVVTKKNGQIAVYTGTEWIYGGGGGGSVNWDSITGKPSSFPPSAHTHQRTEVDGLPESLSALGDAVAAKQDALTAQQIANIAAVTAKRDRTDRFWEEYKWNLSSKGIRNFDQVLEGGDGGAAYNIIVEGESVGYVVKSRGGILFADLEEARNDTHGYFEGYSSYGDVYRTASANLALTTEIPTAAERTALAGLIQRVQSLNPATSTIADVITALKGN